MWSGRALVLVSLASVAAALLVTVLAGWAFGLALYAASVVALGLLLQHMIRQQRGRRGEAGLRRADEAEPQS